eukprot:m.75282 g.75282  ORF g.75282 m.75282 type:complete len:96 (+) comp18941_c0_seq8:4911-5198(+)
MHCARPQCITFDQKFVNYCLEVAQGSGIGPRVMSRPRKQEQGEFALMDQLYEANTKVEALLGVKKALEINLQLYQVWNPSPILQIAIACRVPCES